MALLKYQDVLTFAKEKLKETMAPLRAREMRKKGELEVAKLEGTIAEKEQKLQEIASSYPINFDTMIEALDDLELTKRRKTQFDKIIEELFA